VATIEFGVVDGAKEDEEEPDADDELVPAVVTILLIGVGIGVLPFVEANSICSCLDKVLIKL
jgi:hypothetical protein